MEDLQCRWAALFLVLEDLTGGVNKSGSLSFSTAVAKVTLTKDGINIVTPVN